MRKKHTRFMMSAIILCTLILLMHSLTFSAGWEVRNPEYFNMDSDELSGIFDQAQQMTPPLESLLISRYSVIIAEKYFGNMAAHKKANLKSASKSILSVLVGIAIKQGYLEGINQQIKDFFPEYFDSNPNSRKASIAIRDLITMQSGLETTSFWNYGKWVSSSNWVRWTLERPMVDEPGGEMIYSTGNSHLLSVILTRATGMSTLQFARKYLFEPLDIESVRWETDPQGYYFGGNNMALRPRDLLKIGHLYLNGGRYNGKQVVPVGWVKQSLDQYAQSQYSHHYQGYYWWSDTFAGKRVFFAWGYGGQYCFVIPDLEMAVVVTSSLYNRQRHEYYHNSKILDLLEHHIIPAAQ